MVVVQQPSRDGGGELCVSSFLGEGGGGARRCIARSGRETGLTLTIASLIIQNLPHTAPPERSHRSLSSHHATHCSILRALHVTRVWRPQRPASLLIGAPGQPLIFASFARSLLWMRDPPLRNTPRAKTPRRQSSLKDERRLEGALALELPAFPFHVPEA